MRCFRSNSKGEKVTAPAHGGMINIQGVTVATVNDKVQLQKVETWFDPLEMFRQIAPKGIINKGIVMPSSSDSKSGEKTREEASSGIDNPEAPHSVPHDDAAMKEASETLTSASKSSAAGANTCPFLLQGAAVAAEKIKEETKNAKQEMSHIEGEEREAFNKE